MEKTGNLVWFVAGASIGATLALLFAPQSGKATRRYLDRQTRAGRRKISDAGRDALDRGRDLYERGREMADEVADEVADGASNLVDRGREAIGR